MCPLRKSWGIFDGYCNVKLIFSCVLTELNPLVFLYSKLDRAVNKHGYFVLMVFKSFSGLWSWNAFWNFKRNTYKVAKTYNHSIIFALFPNKWHKLKLQWHKLTFVCILTYHLWSCDKIDESTCEHLEECFAYFIMERGGADNHKAGWTVWRSFF